MNQRIQYVTNFQRQILTCSEPTWNAFARLNEGADLVPFPQGNDLLRFIAGDEVRDITLAIMQHVLNRNGQHFRISFRCDAPHAIREGQLDVSAIVSSGATIGVFFVSHIIAERPRSRHAGCLQRRSAANVRWPKLMYCSYCSRVSTHLSGWIDLEDFYGGGGTDEVQLQQSICPRCRDDVVNRLV